MSVERIRKLLAMTVANGCTESEAMAAAEKAARLMAELGLGFGDLDFGIESVKPGAGIRSVRVRLWSTIADCTNTDFIVRGNRSIEYLGRQPWPEVACYLHALTHRAIERELRTFRATAWYRKRKSLRAKRAAGHDFTVAMIIRLNRKLVELFAATQSYAAIAAAQEELARRYPNSVMVAERRTRPSLPHYESAYAAGAMAGEAVQVAHGVGAKANERALQIGGPS